jgi:carboxymethylenebutenolidase
MRSWRRRQATARSRFARPDFKLGAFAVAPDYYFRKGDLSKISEMSQLMPLVNAKADAELIADLDATVAWAKGQGGDTTRLGIIGFCRGGRTVWLYCANGPKVSAGVAFYGSLVDPPAQKAIWPKSPAELAPEMKAPVLGLYGQADQGIPVAQVEEMRAALAAAGKPAQFQDLSRSAAWLPRGLSSELPQGRRGDAWREMTAWFKTHKVLS